MPLEQNLLVTTAYETQRCDWHIPRETLNPARLLGVLHQIAQAVAVMPEMRELGRLVAERACELVHADCVAIFAWHNATNELRATVSFPEEPAIPPVAPGSGAVGAAFQEMRPISLGNYPSSVDALDWAVSLGVRTIAAVPLISAREPIGVLAAWRFTSHGYTAGQVEILSLLGTLGVAPALAAAMLRSRMREQNAQLSLEAPSANNPRLTRREREILPLVAQGHTNREIGSLLDLSPGTVRNLMARLLAKLGARDRTHAVVLALRRGLLR
jgi:DNA-binding CsgD family transcriptional regulator